VIREVGIEIRRNLGTKKEPKWYRNLNSGKDKGRVNAIKKTVFGKRGGRAPCLTIPVDVEGVINVARTKSSSQNDIPPRFLEDLLDNLKRKVIFSYKIKYYIKGEINVVPESDEENREGVGMVNWEIVLPHKAEFDLRLKADPEAGQLSLMGIKRPGYRYLSEKDATLKGSGAAGKGIRYKLRQDIKQGVQKHLFYNKNSNNMTPVSIDNIHAPVTKDGEVKSERIGSAKAYLDFDLAFMWQVKARYEPYVEVTPAGPAPPLP